ncbi:uncharacterized protein BCR38DRAFT_355377 [Pseudomassariella vexata]|uniref:Rhodopsin domain-containing protein n=1 Tax=Pseudomassariella vexata TaxID=1141098 RepID=A0A1Y2DCL8_9PEZI|nr:uncharacterized protein BCR38DRAFT_355377 [Pseudomassariella vexata]ORY57009.1 hypothetical protein BCR38DRAFT_355377 [Pseudomassariella vexata]
MGPWPAGLGADDWFILASLIVTWAMVAIRWHQILVDHYGFHADELSAATLIDFQKSFLACQEVYFLDALLIKSSLLYMYYRIFGISQRFTKILWATWSLVVTYFITCVILSIFSCHPVSLLWDRSQPGNCIDEVNFFRSNGIVNMLLDVIVFCLPLPMVWRLHMGFRQRLVSTGIFLLGGFVCVVSILRIITFDHMNPTDFTYTNVHTGIWSLVEQSTAILCACLPTLKPLLRRVPPTIGRLVPFINTSVKLGCLDTQNQSRRDGGAGGFS